MCGTNSSLWIIIILIILFCGCGGSNWGCGNICGGNGGCENNCNCACTC